MNITAKVVCNLKSDFNSGGDRYTTLGFCADYQDDRNKEWAYYTPSLDLRMTVKGSVGDRFEQGARYTLTFTQEDGE